MQILRKKSEDIAPEMIGLFFEDINFAADGGLYAELIENRSFEARDSYGLSGYFYTVEDCGYAWSAVSNSEKLPVMQYVMGTPLSEANPHYLRFTATEAGQGFANKAYDGIYLKKGAKVNVVFYARAVEYEGSLKVAIKKAGREMCTATVEIKSSIPFTPFANLTTQWCDDEHLKALDRSKMAPASTWVKYETSLTAQEDIEAGEFVIQLNAAGVIDFDFISVIPDDAVAGIFRKDLFEALKEIQPGFIRFPGGCIVEGMSLENRYRWKRTVGKNIDRKYIPNLWSFDYDNSKGLNAQRKDSHYGQSYGIGFYEYFLLCELLGAKALPVLSMGIACQFRSTEVTELDSPEFNEFIQDAIDLIEFANGAVDTKWGALRAKMGHPESFKLEMLAIGNEQWETKTLKLFDRNDRFEKAIHAVYPGFKLIGTAGPAVDMELATIAWDYYREGKKKNPDFCYAVDEHYYKPAQWMFDNIGLYDNYPRDIAVFAGEYATHTENKGNNMEAALSEAAFMTGFEKNAGVVKLASYAPLFNRIGHSQWKPDMIWFDAQNVYRTPNYYVQQLYATNMGSHTLELTDEAIALREKGIYVALSETDAGETILKVVNVKDNDFELPLADENNNDIKVNAVVKTLHATGEEPNDMPQPSVVDTENKEINGKITIPANSFVVVRY